MTTHSNDDTTRQCTPKICFLAPALAKQYYCSQSAPTLKCALRIGTKCCASNGDTAGTIHSRSMQPRRSTDDASVAASLNFQSFADECGILMNKLELAIFPGNLRGVRAKSGISKNDVLMSAPSSAVLQVSTLDATRSPISDKICTETWRKLPWYARLAILLHVQRLSQQHRWTQWIEMLPRSYDIPFYWKQHELNELQNKSVIDAVEAQRKSYRNVYATIKENDQNTLTDFMSYDDFVWAVHSVRSRAFSGSMEVAPFKERLRLMLFVAANTVAWPLLHVLDWGNAINGEGLVA